MAAKSHFCKHSFRTSTCPPARIHTHTHTHTRARACTHTRTHTHTHTHTLLHTLCLTKQINGILGFHSRMGGKRRGRPQGGNPAKKTTAVPEVLTRTPRPVEGMGVQGKTRAVGWLEYRRVQDHTRGRSFRLLVRSTACVVQIPDPQWWGATVLAKVGITLGASVSSHPPPETGAAEAVSRNSRYSVRTLFLQLYNLLPSRSRLSGAI
jgi:hypothetical protein